MSPCFQAITVHHATAIARTISSKTSDAIRHNREALRAPVKFPLKLLDAGKQRLSLALLHEDT
jgi:hypothetical protein